MVYILLICWLDFKMTTDVYNTHSYSAIKALPWIYDTHVWILDLSKSKDSYVKTAMLNFFACVSVWGLWQFLGKSGFFPIK